MIAPAPISPEGSAASRLETQGFAIVANGITPDRIGPLLAALVDAPHAVRNLFEAAPEVVSLARCPEVRRPVESILGPRAFAVRGILFDKTPRANWKVAWHQDLTIAVKERDVAGFGPWSEKAGIVHVQPPAALLERMVTVRVHLDACDAENGPLRIIPGSHRFGRLDAEAIAARRTACPEEVVTVDRGGMLLMRPLILHASSPALAPGHRRVIHLEFAAEDLPGSLEWHGRW